MASHQQLLDGAARVALDPTVPQPEESLCSPSTSGPRPGAEGAAAKPWERIRSSLRASLFEGAAAEVFSACAGGGVLTGWALHLGASPFVIGLLGALPVACNVLNLPAAWLTHALGRKRLAVAAIGASRLIYLPLVVLPFLSLPDATRLKCFSVLVAAGSILAVIGNNAWIAWMGDLVPGPVRGRFFGRRTVYLTLGGAASSLGVGLVLDALTLRGWKNETLAGLAAVACLAGLASIWLLQHQHEPGVDSKQAEPGGWAALAACLRDQTVRPFLWYQLGWHAAVASVAAFISFHMLVNLQMGFTVVAAHGVGVALVRIVSAPFWGRAVDRLGARPVLVLCSFGVALVPAIWMLPTPQRLWPIALEAVVSGVLWGGHGIAAVDLSIALAPRRGRPFYLAAFATAGGLGFAVASILAGVLASLLPARFPLLGLTWTSVHVLLLISAVGRVAASLLALRIQEPNARGVPELLRTLAGHLPNAATLKRLPVVPKWGTLQPARGHLAAQSRRRPAPVATP